MRAGSRKAPTRWLTRRQQSGVKNMRTERTTKGPGSPQPRALPLPSLSKPFGAFAPLPPGKGVARTVIRGQGERSRWHSSRRPVPRAACLAAPSGRSAPAARTESPPAPPRRPRGVALACAALALLAVLATVAPEHAAAQTETTFISTTGQTSGPFDTTDLRAVAFTTGAGTYTLSSVVLFLINVLATSTPEVLIYSGRATP